MFQSAPRDCSRGDSKKAVSPQLSATSPNGSVHPLSIMRFATLLLLLTATMTAVAQDWPRFRGPNGSGIGKADLPGQWTAANRMWSVKLPGTGHGSPVVWGDRVFLMGGDEATGRRTAACFSTKDGRCLWQRDFEALAGEPFVPRQVHGLNSSGTGLSWRRPGVRWSGGRTASRVDLGGESARPPFVWRGT
jgi:hypothetical protein